MDRPRVKIFPKYQLQLLFFFVGCIITWGENSSENHILQEKSSNIFVIKKLKLKFPTHPAENILEQIFYFKVLANR